jgi:hypothetical protein
VVRLVVGREATAAHVVGKGGDGLHRGVAQRGVAADELGCHALLDAEHVVVHEHLAIAVAAGPDADGRHVDGVGHHGGHPVGHALEDDGEAPRRGQGLGVGDQRQGGVVLAALDLEPAHGVERLRRQAEVAHHRDLGVDQGLDDRQALAAAFQLHGLGTGPDERRRVADGLVDRGVVAHPGQVAHDEWRRAVGGRGGEAPPDGGRVVGDVVDAHLQGVVVAQDHHRHGVADQDHVDAGGMRLARAGGVVGGDHDQGRGAFSRFRSTDRRHGTSAHGTFLLVSSSAWMAAGGRRSR